MMLLFLTTSCNDSNLIGAEVVDPDRADVEFTDTLTLLGTSVFGDSVRTYNSLSLLGSYLCGTLDDPILGRSESDIYTQLRLGGTPDSSVFQGLSGGTTKLDSVIFVLTYDTASFFGKINTEQDISVHILDEDMDNNADYYSDQSFSANEQLAIGTVNPSKFDTTFSIISGGDTIRPPQMRITVDRNHPLFTDILFNENSMEYYQNDTSLLNVFRGLKIESSATGGDNDLMMAFSLSSGVSGLYLYYHIPGGDSTFYRFRVNNNAAQMVNFNQDYTGSFANDFISSNPPQDSLLFVQGMSGLNTKLSIPYARNLQNVIVNQAQLEFTLATILPQDDPAFHEDPLSQLLISKLDEDGNLEVIADLASAFNLGNVTGIFGGNITTEEDETVILRKYTMNISEHLQDIINGVETNNEIFISALAKAQIAQRSILFGPTHTQYPVKLNLTYTINQ